MSLYGSFLSDEQFLCSICLDVFTNPSTTPCGHSFCMACISKYWDGSKVCQCPLCKTTYQKRPNLQINRTLREITIEFRSMTGGGVCVHPDVAGLILTGFFGTEPQSSQCPGEPLRTSSSSSSLPPHQQPEKVHRERDVQQLEPPSLVHGGLTVCWFQMYCRTDRLCICPECETEDHQAHDTVTLEAEWMETKDQLSVSEQEIREMIRQRIKKIEEIRLSSAELESAVERETAGSVCLFAELVSAIQRAQVELMEVMEMSRRAAEHQADAMIRQLELEVEELRRRESALSELAHSEDYMHCVKTFPLLCSPPPTRDWSGLSVNSDLGTGTVYRSLAALVDQFQEELKVIAGTGFPASVLDPSPARTQPRMRRVQEYAVDVTLDCNTAHPRLILSEDMKSVRCGDRHQLLPDNPERFDRVVCVIGREAISSGRHYWEVEVGGKTDWDLGVARQSINRKGKIEVTPSNGYWFLSLRDKSKYAFRTEPSTDVQLNLRPQRIGVFVDFDKGQVSFYNVDAKIHIYTFNDTFTECIFPFFSPCTNKSGKNDGPLVITPVNTAE
ncbi:E3 ubiquitin-protein ligase TRIM39-like [Centropristis striata]|uniref:E3 ubiquitin-protein ligase TRIM39-like n=1 Tax=Centropristis striata TaxID=184440 RepID=UPI0027DFA3B5|nr:E3 ubiquitin-protein ligase TRIM39-like [Centropristis striata]